MFMGCLASYWMDIEEHMLKEIQDQFHGTDRPNMTQLLRALKAQHFEYGAIAGQRGWYAVKLE